MWIVKSIEEADFGCEERLPGEPLMVLVTIECDEDGRLCRFECADSWLLAQDIDEGDEWVEDIDEIDTEKERAAHMSDWMEKYYEAVAEMEE